jgi:Zn-dependent peptidase ImmA (M78 family)/DNA-binding XRE family transcriptional regulator
MMFSPVRLIVARERRGLNKSQLAERVAVTRRSITGYERGDVTPSAEVVDRLASTLKFPRAFFFGESLTRIDPRVPSFRSLSTTTAAQRGAVLAAGALAFELNRALEERLSLPVPDVPDLRGENPRTAAELVREIWTLGDRPIKNMVHLLEAHGVRVFSLTNDCREVDAFTAWNGQTPFVFLNTSKSGERGRFDCGHELAHLVLHRDCEPRGRAAEKEANDFASAFLMPRRSVIAAAPRTATLRNLVSLKKRWKIAVSALAYRLHDLGRITDWQYQTLCMQISKNGWRTREPDGIPTETSQLLRKAFGILREDGVTYSQLAADVRIAPDDLDSLVFHLALRPIDGGNGPAAPGHRQTPDLRLV